MTVIIPRLQLAGLVKKEGSTDATRCERSSTGQQVGLGCSTSAADSAGAQPRQGRAYNEEDVTPLSGENEALRTSVLDLFPAANPKLVAKIITKEFEPFCCKFGGTASPPPSRFPS